MRSTSSDSPHVWGRYMLRSVGEARSFPCVARGWPGCYPSSGNLERLFGVHKRGCLRFSGSSRGVRCALCCRRGPIARGTPAASVCNMADPEASRDVKDLLVEEDMGSEEAVPSLTAGPSYLASSSDEGEADGNPSRAATSCVLTGRPSGGLMSVCSGTTALSGGRQPRVVEALPPALAARLGAGAGARVGLSQGGPAGGNGVEASGVGGGNFPSVMAVQCGPGPRSPAARRLS